MQPCQPGLLSNKFRPTLRLESLQGHLAVASRQATDELDIQVYIYIIYYIYILQYIYMIYYVQYVYIYMI